MNIKNRLKNYALYVSAIAFIPLLVEALGDYDIIVKLPGNYDKLAYAILGILVLLGIINNPDTKKHGFGDDN